MAAKFVSLQNMIQTLSNFTQTLYTPCIKFFTEYNLCLAMDRWSWCP